MSFLSATYNSFFDINYVFKVSYNDIILANEKAIPLSRNSVNQFKTEFHRFMFKKAGVTNV